MAEIKVEDKTTSFSRTAVHPKEFANEQEVFDNDMFRGAGLFFDNRADESAKLFDTNSAVDPVYALGTSCLAFMKAFISFSESDIKQCTEILEHTEALADAQIAMYNHHSQSISQTVIGLFWSKKDTSKSVSDSRTPIVENGLLRAHVIKAEVNLLIGLLCLFQESVLGLIRAGLRLRKGYKSYSKVWGEYLKLSESDMANIDKHTRGGVQFGIGVCNIALASLPTKLLNLIAVLGIKGNKKLGFKLLHEAAEVNTIRSPLASFFLLVFYGILSSFVPAILGPMQIPKADSILAIELERHPNSTIHLYEAGRVYRVKKDLKKSTEFFVKSIQVQDFWKEVHYLSYYELAMNAALELEWDSAYLYMDKLFEENSWSKAYYCYKMACCKVMLNQREEAQELFKEVPSLVTRTYAGRTLHVEQYVSRKAKKYIQTNFATVMRPGFDLILIWNGFCFMSEQNLKTVLAEVENILYTIQWWRQQNESIAKEFSVLVKSMRVSERAGTPTGMWTPPDRKCTQQECIELSASLHLMRGVILRELGLFSEAEEDFKWIVMDNSELVWSCDDSFVVPFCWYEYGVLKWVQNEKDEAKKFFCKGKEFTGYSFGM
ncbi:Tetratricopeptide repeat protein 39B [Nowakowskiella sp. JEL0407]|nr:Tetratricopeptide repeat protein 39B [Nowakowskiella sp. JEL0407]